MDLDLVPESANMILAANTGIQMTFSLKVKPDSPRFEFPGGDNMNECIFSLRMLLASQTKQDLEDGRIGEIRPSTVKLSEPHTPCGPMLMITAQVADDQFNLVYMESSKGNFPLLISVGISDEPEHDGLADNVWTGPKNLAVWNIQFFFKFTEKKEA
jgi:hypothetical protein